MKKAFTLVELISVIIIIGVVALISTPIVTNIIDKSKEKAYEETIANIESAAYYYSVSNELGYKQSYESIALKTLKIKGYMENDETIDPRNNTQMEGCVFYRWLLDKKQYEFIYDDDCVVDDIYPEIKINTLNENKLWLQEKLKFEIDSKYDSYKYCVGKNECEIDNEYKGTTTVEKDGENMYICAVGYFGDVPGKSTCVGPYNVDTVSPEITSNKVTYTSSKIIVNATCSDDTSLVKEIKYSINGGEYQESNLFTNLKTGEYKVKTKCIDNALNESEVEATVELKMSAPTIAQVSQTPSSGTYAQSRIIRITYNSTNIENPRYYYSLDNSTWTEVTSTTKDIEFTSNGYLYAKTVDNAGNTASAAAYTVVNVDSSKPSTSIAVSNVKTDRATVTATCSDNESKIAKYEFSKDNGSTWTANGTTASYTFTGLTQGTSYTFAIRCTNGSGLTKTASGAKTTATITAPTIAQASQSPSSGTYAQSRVIKITYTATNVTSPEYYFKSSVAATVASGVVTHACGTSTNPGTCSASSVTTLAANTWYKTSSTTPSITYKANGYLYAQTWDPADNSAAASTFTVANIDTTVPTASIATSVKTDRATVTATCADSESSIAKYEYSKDGGSTWTANGTTASYTFTGLTQGTSYTFAVRCTNGSGLTKTASGAKSTATIAAPTIAQASQSPSSGTYAQSRVIKITYTATNIQSPEYYFKSSVAATVASGVVTHACGTSTNPGTCSASTVTTLAANTWYKTSSTTPSITYKANGNLYAQTWDPTDNTATASTFTITNVDTAAPTVNVAVSGKVATITLKDNLSLAGYAVNTSSTAVSSWTSITGTSATKTWTATEAGTYYAWVKDSSGRTAKVSFVIDSSVFCSAKVGMTWNFAYTGNVQEFKAECPGLYKLEVWGAQGGQGGGYAGGAGGYSSGNVVFSEGETIYIGVGGQGGSHTSTPTGTYEAILTGGYNGGGNGLVLGNQHPSAGSATFAGGAGGGLTHIAKVSGTLKEIGYASAVTNNNLLIVAGGGGGGSLYGAKKGNVGGEPTKLTTNFGYAESTSVTGAYGGGGGGFQGGAINSGVSIGGGYGGASYIGGVINGEQISGNSSMPTHDGTGTMIGNTGNGYAKITYISESDYEVGQIWNFEYVNNIQKFVVPVTGTYKLEVYGAQGGQGGSKIGGSGGYASGNVTLSAGTGLYIGVGGKGESYAATPTGTTEVVTYGGYNGGGNGLALGNQHPSAGSGTFAGGAGGGLTHIAKVHGTLKDIGYESAVTNNNLLIVAGGGGGANRSQNGYAGGGTTNLTTNFGFSSTSNSPYGGGGGGYYGGNTGGYGGSSYIGGVTNGSMTEGQRSGNGYARITLVN